MKRMVVVAALWALMGGCSTPEAGSTAATGRVSAATAARASFARTLAWGSGGAQVGGTPRGTDRLAEGPSAVAVGPRGAVYVLDRLNGRVLRVTDRAVASVATVPKDSEDLAVGADRSGEAVVAAWSPLRARVWLRAGGQDAGAVAVPRVLRLARGIVLGASRQVLVHNAHQETYRLGSPAAAQLLSAVLHSKREGAFFLADGSGVQVRRRVADGRAEVWVLGAGERTTVKRRLVLDDVAMGVRLVGAAGGHVCLRLEKAVVGRSRGIALRREVVCLRSDGVEVLRQALAAPGRYLPRRELALGGSPPALAWIHPTEAGLQVRTWSLPWRPSASTAAAAAGTEVAP